MIFRDKMTLRIATARKFAHVVAASETVQRRIVELGKVAAMNLQPQTARALLERRDLAFR